MHDPKDDRDCVRARGCSRRFDPQFEKGQGQTDDIVALHCLDTHPAVDLAQHHVLLLSFQPSLLVVRVSCAEVRPRDPRYVDTAAITHQLHNVINIRSVVCRGIIPIRLTLTGMHAACTAAHHTALTCQHLHELCQHR